MSHPDLDLARTNIDRLLKARRTEQPAGNGGASRNGSSVGETLKSMQRVFKVAPRYQQTAALLERGIHSAAAIHAMGETRFVREFAKDESLHTRGRLAPPITRRRISTRRARCLAGSFRPPRVR